MRRRYHPAAWLRAAASVVVVGTLYFAFPFRQERAVAVRLTVFAIALILLGWLLVTQIRRAARPDGLLADRLSGLVTLVDLVVAAFGGVYFAMAAQFHGLRTPLDALYFSVTTLATVGYGDITPVSQYARAVTIVQMIFDLVIVTSAISIAASARRR
jgi:voltage-gated potassium channel